MLTMKDIRRDGDPALRKVAEEVALPPSEEDKQTLQTMMDFVQNSQDEEISEAYELRPGIGLAAPQIGVNKRMFVAHLYDDHDKLYSYALFNPKVISHSVQQSYLENGEGCLSVDEPIEGIVPRHARVTIKGHDLYQGDVKLRLRGLPAINFQHEIDHLNGIMFYDHINQEQPLVPPQGAKAVSH